MDNNLLDQNQEQLLEERLGGEISRKISISNYGTVGRGTYEKPFNAFAKEVFANIRSGKNLVKYDKETNSFYLIDKNNDHPTAHKIDMDESTMKDFAKGKADKYTAKLSELCKSSKEQVALAKKERERESLIYKLDATYDGNTEISPLDAKIYLDHLEKQDKENRLDIVKEAGKATLAGGIPVATGLITVISLIGGAPFSLAALGGGALIFGLASGAAVILEDTILMATRDSWQFLGNISDIIKQARDNIKESTSKLKINNLKEKSLKQIPYVDKMVLPNSVTVEEKEPIEELELQDPMLDAIDTVVTKMNDLNAQDKAELLEEAKSTLKEYRDRTANLINQDKTTYDPEADSHIKIRTDIATRLGKMELKLAKAKIKEGRISAIEGETELLSNKIDMMKMFDSDENTNVETKNNELQGRNK